MMDVPVVPAARLKGDVVNANLCGGQGCQIAFSAEILCKTDCWFSHQAVEVPGEGTSNEWCEPVPEETYKELR